MFSSSTFCLSPFYPLLLPSRGGRTWALNSECKIDQAEFTGWMSFLLSNLLEEISPKYPFISMELLKKKRFMCECFDLVKMHSVLIGNNYTKIWSLWSLYK